MKITEKIDDILVYIGFYSFLRIIKDWIYPGYYLRNLLFNRYDRIKIPNVKPYEYVENDYLMLCANMKIIVDFIEIEEPEKYICWYKDENGNDYGHKYGENGNVLFPEYKKQYIMDMIKEIYNYWKVIYPLQNEKISYLKDFHSKYLMGEMTETKITDCNLYEIDFDKSNCPKNMDDLWELKLNWSLLDSCVSNRKKLLNEKFILKKIKQMEKEQFNDCQKYLHLCIEVRPYLWT